MKSISLLFLLQISIWVLVVCLLPDMAVQALRKESKKMAAAGFAPARKMRRSFRSRMPPPPPVELGLALGGEFTISCEKKIFSLSKTTCL